MLSVERRRKRGLLPLSTLNSQLPARFRQVRLAENGRSRHEHVGSGGDAQLGFRRFDAAVHLNVERQSATGALGGDFLDLRQHLRHEWLAAKPGFHRHHEHQVDLVQIRRDHLEGRAGTQREPRRAARLANAAEGARDVVVVGLHVDRQIAGAGQKAIEVTLGMLDHEVDVGRNIDLLADRRAKRRAERNIVHEMAVHHVEVNPVRAGGLSAANFRAEVGKISRQHRRGDESFGIIESHK